MYRTWKYFCIVFYNVFKKFKKKLFNTSILKLCLIIKRDGNKIIFKLLH